MINYDQYFSVMLKQRQVAAFKKHSKEIDLNKYVISKRKKRHFFISNTLKGQCLDDSHCVGKLIFRIERPRSAQRFR